MARRGRGRWLGMANPRVRRVPRAAACSTPLEVSLWIAVFSLAGGDLLYAGGSGPLWGVLTMVVIGGVVLAFVDWTRRRR
jgi:uncharacterized membrane protein